MYVNMYTTGSDIPDVWKNHSQAFSNIFFKLVVIFQQSPFQQGHIMYDSFFIKKSQLFKFEIKFNLIFFV